jgi:hypothetical protein
MQTKQKLWFKRKRYGWGWTPCTWQGWFCVAVFIILVLCLSTRIDDSFSNSEVFMQLIMPVAILVLAFLRLAYAKGEKPRWQWGGK